MYKLQDTWKIELNKIGLPSGQQGPGGRLLYLRATNITKKDSFLLPFTGKVKSDDIITDRFNKQFGILLPGETEELHLLRGTGTRNATNAQKHVVSIFFESVAIEFVVTAMGVKFQGEIENRTDIFTRSHLESGGDLPDYRED